MSRAGEAAGTAPAATGRELFAAGFVTFSLLYETQPVLPLIAGTYGLSPAGASLSLSAATFALALGMLLAAPLSNAKGRVGVLRVAIVAAALLGLLVPFAPTFPLLVALRAVQGLALAGVPAVAMAYLAEEVEPKRAGAAMGLFIAGNAVGGMVGRLLVGLLSAELGWKGGLWGLALLDLALAAWFARNVPPSRRFRPRPFRRDAILRGLAASGRDPVLLGLYAMAFLVMGSFVTVYNYLAFSLEGPPWRLPPSVVSWVFLLYTVGIFTSPLAGRVSDRVGRPRVLMAGAALQLAGAVATLAEPLPLKLLGLALFTLGFFAAHAVASTGVGHRGGAEKAAASAHYLLAYYAGSSVVGTLGGVVFARAGWGGVVALVSALLALAVCVAAGLGKGARPLSASSYHPAMPPSLLDAATREGFIARIRAVGPDATPRFGTLTAGRMVCHLLDGLKIAFGESRPGPVFSPLRNALGRWLVIWSPIPWPKGKVKAPPGFFSTAPATFEADRDTLVDYVKRFERPGEISWGTSPLLGTLDAREWGALNARHLEHHLSQFGV